MLNVRAGRIGRVALALPAALATAVLILGLHAALLPEGHWQGDEYIAAAFARDGHLRYLWAARIGGWSPRPYSEILFYGYLRIATALKQPLIVPFLTLLWATLLASTLVTMRRQPGGSARVLIGLVVCCMFLLGQKVAEMFYWPAGAVAYMSTLAATSLVLFLLVDARTTRLPGVIGLSASLAICAASSESGALAAAPLALVLAASSHAHRRRAWLILSPLLIVGFVFWMLAHHRMDAALHQQTPLRQLLQSFRPVPDVLLQDIRSSWGAKLLLVLGLRWCWVHPSGSEHPHPALPGFAAALLAGAAATIAASYFQTGDLCCERHDTLRQDWIILALAALAIWSTRWPARANAARLGPVALLAACLLGVMPRLPAFIGDFRLMHRIAAVDRANWRTGRDPQTQAMVFALPPRTVIAGSVLLPPGRYDRLTRKTWFAQGIMDFFGKQSLTILLR